MVSNASKSPGKRQVLIIHQNFPGQFRHVASALMERDDIELCAIAKEGAVGLPGVRCLHYKPHRQSKSSTHPYCRKMEDAVLHGQAVYHLLLRLKKSGFVPEVVLAHPGWGETMYLRDVFAQTRLVHLCEWFYTASSPDLDFDGEFPIKINERLRVRTWQAHHFLGLDACDVAIAPTHWQKRQFPKAYQDKIQVLHEGIDTTALGPNANATLTLPDGRVLGYGDPIVTYMARNLEPYRGFHIFMRSLPELLKAHPECHVVVVGGDGVSYGSRPKDATNWRLKMLRELGSLPNPIDRSHVHFLGKVPFESYRLLLRLSSAHVYLSYPFVLSWSMLEAMSCGCVVIGSRTPPVQEVIRHGENGLLVDFFSPTEIVAAVGAALQNPKAMHKLRLAARQTVVQGYGAQQGVAGYLEAMGLNAKA